jgi:hypothetical protein
MTRVKTVAAAAAAALVAHVRATEVALPPCLDPFQPFVYAGCFAEVEGKQILPYRSMADQQQGTIEKCVAECKGNGYRYAGLVYYGVCWCGQTVQGQVADESMCNAPCNGNSSEICGGNGHFSIYQDPTFPAEPVTIEDYDPVGCWTDDSPLGRALVYKQDHVSKPGMTTEDCLEACRAGGFPFAGTEYGSECWCGVVIGNGTQAAPAEQCNMPCSGNEDQKCGGPNRLNLYVADELQSLEPCGYVPPPPEESTTAAPETTAPPTSTPTSPATTTAPAVCTTTTVIPPVCEYKLGKWCSNPLPDWNDGKSCKEAWKQCYLQVTSCFKYAGWPDVLECFDFGNWCSDLDKYCLAKPGPAGCRKSDYYGKKPPKGAAKPVTSTITVPCATATPSTTTTTSTTTQTPVPPPTNICKQPTGKDYPLGGIPLPIVTCNDIKNDYPSYPFKIYNHPDTKKCGKYGRTKVTNACLDACKEQYDDCVQVYAEGCRNKQGRKRDLSYFEFAQEKDKRTFGWGWPPIPSGWNDNYNTAVSKCATQYSQCKSLNSYINANDKCKAWGQW